MTHTIHIAKADGNLESILIPDEGLFEGDTTTEKVRNLAKLFETPEFAGYRVNATEWIRVTDNESGDRAVLHRGTTEWVPDQFDVEEDEENAR